MTFNILSIFPNFFTSSLETSILSRAVKQGVIKVNLVNIRDFTQDKHKTTDDRPFGGGAGMIMKIEPIDLALQALKLTKTAKDKIILLSARGKKFDQTKARQLSQFDNLTLICGHYGDVDQRVAEHLVDEELSVGEFVLTGGEPAALIVLDAVTRLLPGVLGNESSLEGESHDQPGQLSPPQYTRPADYHSLKVPEVFLSGDPKKIALWQQKNNFGH